MTTLLPEEQTTLETYDEVADVWVGQYSPPHFWAEEMKRFHQLLPSGTVLEIGAGGWRDAKELLELGYNYVGTDVSGKMIEQARKKLPKKRFYRQSVYDLSFPEKFDGFWASKVLLHIPKTRISEALVCIRSVLKPGAIGFISLIDGNGEELINEDWDNNTSYKRFFAYWTKNEFTKILEKNNFVVVDYMFNNETNRLKWHCFFVKSLKN